MSINGCARCWRRRRKRTTPRISRYPMKRVINIGTLLLLSVVSTRTFAQEPDQAGADERDPTLKNWQWLFELRMPEKADTKYVAVNLPPEVLGKARPELPDLRLTDAKGTRIPFTIRKMDDHFHRQEVQILRTFNAAPSAKNRYYQASYELANVQAPGHNEIEINTTRHGNFRRKVEVFGDENDRFETPKSILGKNKYVVYYEVDGKIVNVHKFRYDFMRYRFLQVRVHADDPSVDEEIPAITSIKVRQVVGVPGELTTEPATLDKQQQTRGDGGPGTSWYILLPDRVPCHLLTFDVSGESSERPIRLEVAEPNQSPMPIFVIEKNWNRPALQPVGPGINDEKRVSMELRFNE